MKSFFIAVLPALLMTGCFLLDGGHERITVSGKIPEGNLSSPGEKCTLYMVAKKHGKEFPKEVAHEFSAQFYPLVFFLFRGDYRKYYFLAECQKGHFFRSREIAIGYGITHFDLGVLVEVSEDPSLREKHD